MNEGGRRPRRGRGRAWSILHPRDQGSGASRMNTHESGSIDGNGTVRTGRREFGRMALGAALGMGAGASLVPAPRALAKVPRIKPGIKLCAQSSPRPTDEQLLFLKQIGAEYVSVGSSPDLRTADG